MVNYSYLSDGTKLSALDGNGGGLVYRGPFVYRKGAGNGNSSLTFESASFSGGRLTSSGALLYVTDYLGSVRAVVNGSNGAIYKASDYSTFGSESKVESIQTASFSPVITLRDSYTGKEAQNPDFSTGYTDFGARQYNSLLRRWMTPDPLSEKYYGTSPYAFCANNPVNLVDLDGRKVRLADNSTPEFKLKFYQNLLYMISKGTAGDLLNIHSSDKVYILAEVQHSSQTRFQINTSTETQIIYWDPNHVVESSNGLWRSPATTLAHEAGHAARYDEAVKNGTITQWLSGCENDESNPYDNHEDEIVITTTEQVVAKKHGEICEGQVTRTDHRGKQVPGDVSNKSPWEIQKDIYEHNELLK